MAVAYDDVGTAFDNRLDKVFDTLLRVLIIAVGIDHYVGSMFERIVDPVTERTRQPHVAAMSDYVFHAKFFRDVYCVVGRAVIDDEPFHRGRTWQFFGHCLEHER